MLIKNSLIYFFADIFNKAVPFLLLPILTTYLTPEDYGIIATFGVFTSILVIFISMNTLGSIEVTFFHISKEKLKIYIANIFFIISVSLIFILLITVLFNSQLTSLLDIPLEWLIVGVFISLAQVVNIINLLLWRVEHKAKNYSFFEITQNLFNVSLTLLFVIAINMDWEGRLLAMAIAMISFGLISFYIVVKVRNYFTFTYNKEYIKDALHYGIPLIPHSLAGWIKTGLDRVFLTSLVGVAATGIYSVGYQLGTIVMVIATSLYKAWLPKLYEMMSNITDEDKKRIVKFTYLYFIGILLLTIILYFSLDIFIKLFIGEEFSESKNIVLFILMAYAFDSMYFAVVPYMFYNKKTKIISAVTISTSAIHAPLSYWLIKEYEMYGATYASVVTFGLTFFVIWYYSNKVYAMPWFSFWRKQCCNPPKK